MIVEILTVGDEVVSGDILNTNTQFLAQKMWQRGYVVEFHTSVRDDEAQIQEALKRAATRADVCLVTGGLGPTDDDFTIEMAAKAFGVKLVTDAEALKALEVWSEKFGRNFLERNRKQALVPEGGRSLRNEKGTAPGVHCEFQNTQFFFLPGVPKEMKWIFQDSLEKMLKPQAKDKHFEFVFLKVFGLPESLMQERLAPLFTERSGIDGVRVGFRVAFPEIYIKLSCWGASQKDCLSQLGAVRTKVEEKLGNNVYADDLDVMIEDLVIQKFKAEGKTLAVAESCTGGLVSHRLTNVPGASDVVLAGLTTYANEVKQELLGVTAETLNTHGAVSEECATEMVQGLRRVTGAQACVATTGIAGPSGGTKDKPVGTVFVAHLFGDDLQVIRYNFPFDRDGFKKVTASRVLFNLLRSE